MDTRFGSEIATSRDSDFERLRLIWVALLGVNPVIDSQ